MFNPAHLHASDLRGLAQLASAGTTGVTDLVEAVHHDILHGGSRRRAEEPRRVRGIAGLVYRSVHGVTRLVGGGLDLALTAVVPLFKSRRSSPDREGFLAIINGVLGDTLAAADNPLAVAMEWRRGGEPLDRAQLQRDGAPAGGRLVVLVHGLCLNDLQWNRRGHDHGAALARDLGVAPLYLRYNSGLHVSVNGRAFADRLEELLAAWPVAVETLAIVGHSMGGLLARSACHYGALAGHAWVGRLRTLIFLGSPHHGAPMERGGHWIDGVLEASPYARALARLGRLRSAGITDLRFGNLLDEDWAGRDRFAHHGDTRRPVPLPPGVASHALAASRGKRLGDVRSRLLGDGIVPVASALGEHTDPALDLHLPPARRWIAYETRHLDLLDSPAVYEQIRQRLA